MLHWTYDFDLSLEPKQQTLKGIISRILNSKEYGLGLSYDLEAIDWNSIYTSAMFSSRKKTTADFMQEFYSRCNSIEILGEYQKSNIGIDCRCKVCKHIWSPTPNSLLRGNRCPNCAPNKPKENDELVAELNLRNKYYQKGIISISFVDRQNEKVSVHCHDCGRNYYARISDLLRGHGCGCSTKGKNRVIPMVNDLASQNPNLCKEWNDFRNGMLKPSNVAANSSRKVWWKCNLCQHEWKATISSRNRGAGCPACWTNRRQLLSSDVNGNSITSSQKTVRNPLSIKSPELAREWHPTKNGTIKPSDISANSKKKVYWLGKCGHEWEASIINRFHGCGCPICSGRLLVTGINDLATVVPNLVIEWNYEKNTDIMPNMVSIGSHERVWWICHNCGNEWEARINDRTSKGGHGCPRCHWNWNITSIGIPKPEQ